ncbi:MAG TPA: hypothetical protein VLN26_15815 [Gaiellaceae bacterium]|nr:hypothetical protein [Gaiellaceae bacterium]
MFGICRYCGAELIHDRAPLEICPRCEDSPLCDRCGHPRGDHGRVFVRGVRGGCNRIVGGGDGPCAVLAMSSRRFQAQGPWGAYTVDEAALRHGAGVEEETRSGPEAYAPYGPPQPGKPDGWDALPWATEP